MVRTFVNAPQALLPAQVFRWSSAFAILAGRGWGATTVNHLLTDLGLSVKPDRHLRRAVVRMGLLDMPSDMSNERIDSQGQKIDPLAVEALIGLSKHVTPTAHPQAWSPLREIDKVLMAWSKTGLLRPL